MASTFDALVCAVAATLLWTILGLPITRRLVPGTLALPIAPALGWAIHSAAVLPLFFLIGFSQARVLGLTALCLVVAIVALLLLRQPTKDAEGGLRVPLWALAVAALLAFAPAAAILPKLAGDSVALAPPIFDHAKVAMIDEMTRLGVPPGNPFFGETGGPTRLAYYYLWHFSAAELALLTGMSGWAADAGLTWFTAFASLAMMMGFAVWISGRASAAHWVLAFSFTASLRPVLALFFKIETLDLVIFPATGFGGWLFQSAWVPQHVASASCVVLAIFFMSQMAQRRSPLLLVTFVLLAVAGFESSAWVGGVAFAVIAAAVGLLILNLAAPSERLPFLMSAAGAAVLALALAAPLLRDQYMMTALSGGVPVVLRPYEVLGELFPATLRHVLDLPAYWLILLPIELPAIYPTGVVAMAAMLAVRTLDPKRKFVVQAFAAMAITSLVVAWLAVSTVGNNNDLGWRALLPAVMALIIFSAVGLSGCLTLRRRLASAAAVAALLLGLYQGAQFVHGDLTGRVAAFSKVFARTSAIWEAVRKHSAPDDRIANNPLFLQDATPWPVNLSWALLSNRRSCFAGRELTLAYVPVPRARQEEINAQFIRVFGGEGSTDDVRDLAIRYGCRVVVVTAQDGAWVSDPFAVSPYYRLAETKPDEWKIYTAPALGLAQAGDALRQ
jgi:hypothetical protein